MTFTVLIACSANICRSPLAAAGLLQAVALGEAGGRIVVDTGGVDALPSAPVCTETARLADAHGLLSQELLEHRARGLTVEQVRSADLVLTADRRVRSTILRRVPQAGPRTFTVREAALLGPAAAPEVHGGDLDERLRSYVTAMNASRGLTDLPRTRRLRIPTAPWRGLTVHGHDIPDAHRGERAAHRTVYRLVTSSIDQVADGLGACARPVWR